MDELLEGEYRIEVKDGEDMLMTGREWAAGQLTEVARCCEHGSYPPNITAFDLGRALGRALTNCNENDPHAELRRGLEHYLSLKKEAT